MADVTQMLQRIELGELSSADLMPVVYEELRRLAKQKLTHEKETPSIQPTLLVHDAYLRLVHQKQQQKWKSRGHFFGAAAEAMRRILIENARLRKTQKRGGDLRKVPLEIVEPAIYQDKVDLLALDEALQQFETDWPEKAQLVKLRYFAGLTIAEAAKSMEISESTAERHWRFARAWLFSRLDS
jgi:RNA polymerase sigma factor (TIGR02999 family)